MLPPQLVRTLPPQALRALAEHFEDIARDLASAADDLERSTARRTDLATHKARVFEAADLVRIGLAQGLTWSAALSHAARASGLDPEAVAEAWRIKERRLERDKKEARNQRIARLKAEGGWTKADLAEAFGLHPKTVQRITRA